jgi:hypothetical protein
LLDIYMDSASRPRDGESCKGTWLRYSFAKRPATKMESND